MVKADQLGANSRLATDLQDETLDVGAVVKVNDARLGPGEASQGWGLQRELGCSPSMPVSRGCGGTDWLARKRTLQPGQSPRLRWHRRQNPPGA